MVQVPRCGCRDAIAPSVPGFVSTLRGLVDGATALTVDGEPVALEPGGAFSVYIAQGATAVELVASSDTGVSTTVSVAVTATPPESSYPATAAVHVRAVEWTDPVVHQQILDLIAAGRIGAVELDIKDEAGEIGYLSTVPFATTVGATRAHYDPVAAINELHGLGVRVIGRIVCFLDPVAAAWAWANARPDMIVLDTAGTPLTNDYGTAAFTNVANPEIRRYQIDVANEAIAIGFDEILYDYVRRPEGDLTAMQLTGLETTPEVAVARFVADTRAALAPTGPTSGCRSSASPPLARKRSDKTSTCSPPTSTTSRRWCIPRTGGRASTASPIRSANPPTSWPHRSPTSTGSSPAAEPLSCHGSRTSTLAASPTPPVKSPPRSTPP